LTLVIDVRNIKNELELRSALRPAIEALRQGGIVIYPTDTVYGIGCDPLNENALSRLLALKGREGKPLPLLASKVEVVKRVAEVTPKAEKLIRSFWPGPLTLVLPVKINFPHQITFGRPKIGVRIPESNVARILAESIGGLIVGTSANKSGEKAPREFKSAYLWAKDKIDVAIDGGLCPIGQPSTVVEINYEIKVIREGAIEINDIMKALRC